MAGILENTRKDIMLGALDFTHGIASLVVIGTLNLNDEEIDKIIADSVRQMLKGYKIEKGEM